MIDVATLSVIRRWALREQLSIREIARRSSLSRNTIKKYLAAEAVEPKYAKRVSVSKLDPYADKLSAWLKSEASKTRKQRRTAVQLHADLVCLGFTGSYGRVAAFARTWQAAQHQAEQTAARGTFVPLSFSPGEAFQFDWSEDWAVIDGESTKLQVAHFKLCHSRAFLLRAYPLQTHEMLFDAHNHAFAVFGGVPRRGIYDLRVDSGQQGGPRQSPRDQHALQRAGKSLPVRSELLQPGRWVGEGPSREERARRTPSAVATHAIGCGNPRRHSPRWMHSTTGCSCAAKHCGARSDTQYCQAPWPMYWR